MFIKIIFCLFQICLNLITLFFRTVLTIAGEKQDVENAVVTAACQVPNIIEINQGWGAGSGSLFFFFQAAPAPYIFLKRLRLLCFF